MRDEDRGLLWEHYVLNEYIGRLQKRTVRYWRDKRGHEVDFVIVKGDKLTAIECKWRADGFDPRNLRAFRNAYPAGDNFVVTSDTERSYVRDDRGVRLRFVGLAELIRRLA